MTLNASDRDDEVREIREVAQKMAERINMRFVLNHDKVRRFRDAAVQDGFEEEVSQIEPSNPDQRVLNT